MSSRVPWVDRPACTGCNICVELCPDVFEIDEDGLATVINPRGDADDVIQEAIDACPESCIGWK